MLDLRMARILKNKSAGKLEMTVAMKLEVKLEKDLGVTLNIKLEK